MAGVGISRRHIVLLGTAGLVSGCGGGLWPFRGSGGGAGRAAATDDTVPGSYAGLPVAPDGTMLMPFLRLAAAEPGRQGVILRAEAVAPTLGFHGPELRSLGRDEAGIETVEFRARPPLAEEPVGPERGRILQGARFYRPHELRDLRGFRLVAAQSVLTSAVP